MKINKNNNKIGMKIIKKRIILIHSIPGSKWHMTNFVLKLKFIEKGRY